MQSFTEEYRKVIEPIIVQSLPSARIILYGSRARKDAREGSDIDIALDVGAPIDNRIMSTIVASIEESDLPISFDIVDFHSVSDKMKQEILKDGVIWQN